MNSVNRELKSGTIGVVLRLSLDLATFAATRHVYWNLRVIRRDVIDRTFGDRGMPKYYTMNKNLFYSLYNITVSGCTCLLVPIPIGT